MRLAGHVYRDKSSPAHKSILWQPTHGSIDPGRPAGTLINTVLRDTNLTSVADLKTCMSNRNV